MLKEGQIRIPSGCAITGIFSKQKNMLNGELMIRSIETMHDRSNGLGGGYAGYGIYPEHIDDYAFHFFFDDTTAKEESEKYLFRYFKLMDQEPIPTRKIKAINKAPIIWRYFLQPLHNKLEHSAVDEKEFVCRKVLHINDKIPGAYVFSSGKNMGVFKGVGFPEDIGEYYKIDMYQGYSWTCHGRYPTNTPGWWGGAHPFALLDTAVVHNGEISSYDANRRYTEMFGYKCNLLTDTEVITYMLDYLIRKQQLTLQEAANVIAAPFWSTIEKMDEQKRKELTYLRNIFSGMLITGPFSIIYSFENGIMALNDRLKLRSMVVGEKDDLVYLASEECAIRVIQPELDYLYAPKGGEPVIVLANEVTGGIQ